MKTRSNILKRLLSLALCICIVLALVPAIPLTANAATPEKLVLDATNWGYGDARFVAYFFGNGEKWVNMTAVDTGIYTCDVPSGFTKVIFVRMNGATSANNWDNKWNQTGDLTIPTNGNNLFTMKQWDNQTSGWSVASCKYSGAHTYNSSNVCTAGCNNTKCYNNNGHTFRSDNVCSDCGTKGKTIYFQNNWRWTDVRVHYWKDGGVATVWPGVALTEPEMAYGPDKENDYWEHYRVIVPEDCDGFKFSGINQNTKEREESNNLSLKEYYDGIAYWMLYNETTQAKTAESFAICLALTDLHKIGDDNICSVCKETRCEIYDHEFEDNICIYCGMSHCAVVGHRFTDYDLCEICGVERIWVFFENDWKLSNVHLYYWYDGVPVIIEWPGVKMDTWKTVTTGGNSLSYLKVQVPADVDSIIINGHDASKNTDEQTPNILASELEGGFYNGITFKLLWDNGNKIDEPYDIDDKWACSADHAYSETQYVWADDYSSCTASRTCTKCGKTQSVENETASWLESAATCTEPEQVGHEAYFDLIYWAEAQQIIVTGEKDPGNHTDIAVKFDNGDGTHTEQYICCDTPVVEGEAHADGNKDGYCDGCSALMAPVQLMKTSASLEGNICVNYFMLLSEEVLNDESAYIQFTMADGEIIEIPVSQSKLIDGYDVFTCEVNAKEMTDIITMQFFYGGNAALADAHEYNVRKYAQNIMQSYGDAKTQKLMEAMVNYGAASQLHFGYNTNDLANMDKEGNALVTIPDYSTVDITGFDYTSGQGTQKVKLYSASLILNSETTLRLFFNGKVTATYQNEELKVYQRAGLYYVDIVGIAAKDLDDDVTIVINDGTEDAQITFSPMTYCQLVHNNNTGAYAEEMKNLARALYLYNQAANAYFGDSVAQGATMSNALHYLNGNKSSTKITEKVTSVTFGRSRDYRNIVMNNTGILMDVEQDVPVYVYYIDDNGKYDLYFLANDDIYLPANCNALFSRMSALVTVNTENLNTSRTVDLTDTFYRCASLQNIDPTGWDVSNVKSLYGTFCRCTSLTSIDLTGWDTSNVIDMKDVFSSSTGLVTIKGLETWDTSNVTDMSSLFSTCTSLVDLGDISGWDTSNVTSLYQTFKRVESLTELNVANWDTSNVTNMNFTFRGARSLTELDLSGWDVSKVTTFSSMFSSEGSNNPDMQLKTIKLANWKPISCTAFSWMFYGCGQLEEIDLRGWDASSVTTTYHMFADCNNLKSVNLSGWNTPNLTNMDGMFNDCRALVSIDLSDLDTHNVEDMSQLFEACASLKEVKGLENWDTSKVWDYSQMFLNCSSIEVIDLSPLNTSAAIQTDHMFQSCASLTTIYVGDGWDMSKVTESGSMFHNCPKLVGGNGTVFDSTKTDLTYACVDTVEAPGYLTYKAA